MQATKASGTQYIPGANSFKKFSEHLDSMTLSKKLSDEEKARAFADLQHYNHLLEYSRTGNHDKYKMACLELRMASTSLNKLQVNSSNYRSLLAKDKITNILAGGCKPYGL